MPGELVSRLLVHLHQFIVGDEVSKNEVLIKVGGLTKAWVRVDVVNSRFVVTIRGGDVKECQKLLEWIVDQAREVGKQYASAMNGVEECVRSRTTVGVTLI